MILTFKISYIFKSHVFWVFPHSREDRNRKGYDFSKYKYYAGNTEWEFFAYKVESTELEDIVGKKNYSTLNIKFGFQRNSPYYTMTLIIPIIVLTLLAPIGLILPGSILSQNTS